MGRRRARRRKRYHVNGKRLAVVLLGVALLAEVVVVALTSPWFCIKSVRVTGLKTLPAREIVKKLSVQPKTNIFSVRAKEVERRLKTDPVVESVSIHRKLPATLIVVVKEREADLVLSVRGAYVDVDGAGIPFRLSKQQGAGPITVVSMDLPGGVIPGKPLRAEGFLLARNCLRLVMERNLPRVAKISVDLNNELCLNVSDEFDIRLGRAERLPEKLDIAARALEQVPELQSRRGYIDVTCVEAPALKLAE